MKELSKKLRDIDRETDPQLEKLYYSIFVVKKLVKKYNRDIKRFQALLMYFFPCTLHQCFDDHSLNTCTMTKSGKCLNLPKREPISIHLLTTSNSP